MSDLIKYRIHCDTDDVEEFVWLEDSEPVPTTCPTNTAHTVTQTAVIEEVQTKELRKTSDNRQIVAIEKSEGSRLTQVSHDWIDRTTWYGSAVRRVDQAGVVLTELSAPPGSPSVRDAYHVGAGATGAWAGQDGKIAQWISGAWKFITLPEGWTFAADKAYVMPHGGIIDSYHGKLWDEDNRLDSGGFSYRVSFTVAAAPVTEHDPHYGDNGDYLLDYLNGIIFFDSATSNGVAVLGTYHESTNSKFVIEPLANKQIVIESVDVQFALDVILTDTSLFIVYGYVGVFAPQLVSETPDYVTTFPANLQIPIATTRYKTMRDYQAECDRAYPQYPAMGGTGWRGLQVPTVVFHWDYVRGVVLKSSLGMKLEISLEHDAPFLGEYATASLYCVSEDEILS